MVCNYFFCIHMLHMYVCIVPIIPAVDMYCMYNYTYGTTKEVNRV